LNGLDDIASLWLTEFKLLSLNYLNITPYKDKTLPLLVEPWQAVFSLALGNILILG